MAQYYKPSGKFSPLSIAYFILITLTIIPLLALLYAYSIRNIPFIYVNVIFAILFGLGIGKAVDLFVIKLGKVRSGKIALLFGVLAALIGFYFHWAAWSYLLVSEETVELFGITFTSINLNGLMEMILSPLGVWQTRGFVNLIGTWGLSGNGNITGIPLTVIWVIEALLIMVPAIFTAIGRDEEPFCELNQRWFSKKTLPAFQALQARAIDALTSTEKGGFVEELQKVNDPTTQNHSIFTLYSNETNENYLSVENQIATINDKGEVSFSDESLVKYLEITEALSNSLEAK